MKYFEFECVLSSRGWEPKTWVGVDYNGVIEEVSQTPPSEKAAVESVPGWLIPGFMNAHSHSFQYAMAGLTEHLCRVGGTHDDFWSWREKMYELALSISPDHLEAIAAMLYCEMLRVGYTHVAEFHYVHHDKDGKKYQNLAEMSERICRAANQAGIRLTLIPIYYERGGFDEPPTDRQRRFVSESVEDYLQLLNECQQKAEPYGFQVGVGFHSLRAVREERFKRVLELASPKLPVHLHIAEQVKEVEQCQQYLGQRPVEWLASQVALDSRFHLVHATHLNESEIGSICSAKANVVLCPSTEANLGDGFFPLDKYQKREGNWAIGSDSHIGLNPIEELRWLEYGQRLLKKSRNILCESEKDESGELLFRSALSGGLAAMGENHSGFLQKGTSLNGVVIDCHHPLLHGLNPRFRLSTLLYAMNPNVIAGTIVHGHWMVKSGVHEGIESISERFKQTITELANRA